MSQSEPNPYLTPANAEVLKDKSPPISVPILAYLVMVVMGGLIGAVLGSEEFRTPADPSGRSMSAFLGSITGLLLFVVYRICIHQSPASDE